MRDPARIDYILKQIKKIWTEYPDLRLGQLLINALTAWSSSRGRVPTEYLNYQLEDDALEEALYKFMGECTPTITKKKWVHSRIVDDKFMRATLELHMHRAAIKVIAANAFVERRGKVEAGRVASDIIADEADFVMNQITKGLYFKREGRNRRDKRNHKEKSP